MAYDEIIADAVRLVPLRYLIRDLRLLEERRRNADILAWLIA